MKLPPIAPVVGFQHRVRLSRDYYVRVVGNDYSVDPRVIGRLVDVHTSLSEVVVTCTAADGTGRVLEVAVDRHDTRRQVDFYLCR